MAQDYWVSNLKQRRHTEKTTSRKTIIYTACLLSNYSEFLYCSLSARGTTKKTDAASME